MKINKVLNNNTAVVIDDNGREKVVIGKGIAFKKKEGDLINLASINKTYSLSSDTLNLKFQEILVNLPMEQLYVVEKIVNCIKESLNRKISDSIYISLSDHIHFTLKNYEKGISVKNNLLHEIIRFYPEEFKIGKMARDIIHDGTGILLPMDEAGFIAMHIVNAEVENYSNKNDVYKMTKIIEEVLNIVKNYFDIEIDEESLEYYRFIYHLRYFSQRIIDHSIFKEDKKDYELMQVLSSRYRESYQCCLNIKSFIKVNYETGIGYEELLYLIIHVQRAIFNE